MSLIATTSSARCHRRQAVVRSQPSWVTGAKSRVVLAGTGDWLKSMLPDDPESTILKRLKRPREDGEEQPGQRSDSTVPGPARNPGEGYERSERAGMRQLIETRAAPAR